MDKVSRRRVDVQLDTGINGTTRAFSAPSSIKFIIVHLEGSEISIWNGIGEQVLGKSRKLQEKDDHLPPGLYHEKIPVSSCKLKDTG